MLLTTEAIVILDGYKPPATPVQTKVDQMLAEIDAENNSHFKDVQLTHQPFATMHNVAESEFEKLKLDMPSMLGQLTKR